MAFLWRGFGGVGEWWWGVLYDWLGGCSEVEIWDAGDGENFNEEVAGSKCECGLGVAVGGECERCSGRC